MVPFTLICPIYEAWQSILILLIFLIAAHNNYLLYGIESLHWDFTFISHKSKISVQGSYPYEQSDVTREKAGNKMQSEHVAYERESLAEFHWEEVGRELRRSTLLAKQYHIIMHHYCTN